jgi:hypothetical protein
MRGQKRVDRGEPKSESTVQAEVRLSAVKYELKLFRNNVGVLVDATGRPVRYGLANESKELNKKIKSGDLIGWRPVFVTEAMVGKVFAQFVSIECKGENSKTAKARAAAQRRWAKLVQDAGGLALILSRAIEADDLQGNINYDDPENDSDGPK